MRRDQIRDLVERISSNVNKVKSSSDVTGGMEKTSTCRDGFIDLLDVFYFIDEVSVKLRWTAE